VGDKLCKDMALTLRFAEFQRHREAAAYAEAEEGETDAYLHLLLSAPAAGRQAGRQSISQAAKQARENASGHLSTVCI
jgi:hypothetical protein